MWEEITTLSEIDTILIGTLIAQENPEENIGIDIYRVTGKTADSISIHPKLNNNNDPDESLIIKSHELFDNGWWMLKEN